MSEPTLEQRLIATVRTLLPLAQAHVVTLEQRADKSQLSEAKLQEFKETVTAAHDIVLVGAVDANANPRVALAEGGPQLYQLADDAETYGDDAGRFLLVSTDGEQELTGPMLRGDADGMLRLLGALQFIADRAGHGKRFGADMHSSATLVLSDVERLARRAVAETITPVENPVREAEPAGMTP